MREREKKTWIYFVYMTAIILYSVLFLSDIFRVYLSTSKFLLITCPLFLISSNRSLPHFHTGYKLQKVTKEGQNKIKINT